MPVHLIFLFLFQSGLAFAFTYFIAKVLLNNDEADSGKVLRLLAGVRKIVIGAAAVLPPAMFFAYYKALPEGKSATLALWPAAWILMILIAVVLALTLCFPKAGKKAASK